MIELAGVCRAFRRGGGAFFALRDIDLAAGRGEIVVFTGRSGSGKTTLLNIIGGLDRATAGTVRVGGREIGALGESALADFRRDTVGFVFQAFHLIEEKTALANVMLPLAFAGAGRREAEARAWERLERVGLGDLARERVRTLSAGQKQRVVLARALVNDPALLIADEPTGNLDKENSRAMFDIMAACAAGGCTILVATHDTAVLPAAFTRRYNLTGGQFDAATVR
ncbi:MAG: ABC transporter ATP-binding protein [Planctomycetota bacterium]